MVFETERVQIFIASLTEEDVEMYYRLWNHPRVKINVGFPDGLEKALVVNDLGVRQLLEAHPICSG